MGIFRLAFCVAVDGALTVFSGGIWLGMANTCMDGTLTQRKIRHQHKMEEIREVQKAITEQYNEH